MINTLMTLMAMQYLNAPYRWAGNGPNEFDCSGLVLKVLHDVGVTLPDMSANTLYLHCKEKAYSVNKSHCDALLFFGSNGKATHVAISIGEINKKPYMIESGGAGRESSTMTLEELGQRDARVRIKPVNSRKDLLASYYIPYNRE